MARLNFMSKLRRKKLAITNVFLINFVRLSFGATKFRFLEIGKILENDGELRKDLAYIKYLENQSKFAENVWFKKIDYTYYLSCIGVIINQLSVENQKNLINRLLLRNKLLED